MENIKRSIDANELLKYVGSRFGFMVSKSELLRAIEMQPTICGQWLDIDGDPVDENYCGYSFVCSKCGFMHRLDNPTYLKEFVNNFCPNCGLDMRRNNDD